MTNYGRIKSSTKPLTLTITEKAVFIAQDIQPYTTTLDEHTINGFEYTLLSYDKDEYIQEMALKNLDLEDQLLSTQEAICDLYEMLTE